MADQAIPIPDVEILITKEIGDDVVIFFRGYTDSSGIIDNITLPAPADTYNVSTETFSEFEVYDLTAVKESFQTLKKIYDWNVRRIKSVAVHQNDSYDSGR